jgi:hypothetical protein
MAYLNSLEKSQKYLDLVLELFKKGSLTQRLDTECMQYDNLDASVVKALIIKTTGLGNYEKDKGYPQGAITAKWENLVLNTDRGVRFMLDRVDNDEVLALTIGKAAQSFVDYEMTPEMDAYRFVKYCDGAGEKKTATLDKDNVLEAIDAADAHLNEKNAPTEGRILFVSQKLETLFNKAVSRTYANEDRINTRIKNYNGMDVIYVPSTRFQTVIQLEPGDTAWGYKAGAGSKDINFMLMHPKSVVQAAKTARGKFIKADENQTVDSDEFLFRIFHDAFVIEALADGVYANTK